MRGTWIALDPNHDIEITLFHSGSVITGTGEMTLSFRTTTQYSVMVLGNYFYPGV